MSQHKHNALYYPFSKCYDSYTLKRAILYFDQIHFMDPLDLEQHENLIETSHYYDGVRAPERRGFLEFIKEVYYFLQDQGVAVNADVYSLITKYDKELTALTKRDISDETFCKYSYGDCSTNNEKVSWHVLGERMPLSLIESMNKSDWQIFRREVAKSAVIYTDIDYSDWISFTQEFREFAPKRDILRLNAFYCNTYVPINLVPLGSRGDADRYLTKSIMPDSGYIVPYAYGASVSISQAMLYAALNNLTLFTDSETMHYLLSRKCQMALEKGNSTVQRLKQYKSLLRKVREKDIIIEAIDTVIGRENLEKLSFHQVLQLRNSCKDQLQAFRSYISVINSIKSSPWEEDYFEEVQQVASKIQNEILKLQVELRSTYEKTFRETLKTVTGISLGIIIMPHNMTLGAALALLAAKDVPIDSIFKLWEAEAATRKHSLSYLLSAKNRSERRPRPWDMVDKRLRS